MKLWNELTEEEQAVLIKFCVDIGKIIETAFVEPLTELIEDLSYFFLAMEGILADQEYLRKSEKNEVPK